MILGAMGKMLSMRSPHRFRCLPKLSTRKPDVRIACETYTDFVPSSSMSQVKDIGGKISAQKKKETILLIVSLILMIVPFVSELGFAVAGLSNLARLAFVAGEVANGAQSIYDIIDDPESAPFAVMGILAGAAGKTGKLEKTFADASAARKVLTDASAMVCISFTEHMRVEY
jgi:hypothetical protein